MEDEPSRDKGPSASSVLSELESAEPLSVIRVPGRVYFKDSEGDIWRVYDSDFGEGKPRPYPPPRRGVPYRYFVAPTGERWVYRYRREDDARDLSPEELERQRRNSEWAPAPKDRYDPSSLGDPR